MTKVYVRKYPTAGVVSLDEDGQERFGARATIDGPSELIWDQTLMKHVLVTTAPVEVHDE